MRLLCCRTCVVCTCSSRWSVTRVYRVEPVSRWRRFLQTTPTTSTWRRTRRSFRRSRTSRSTARRTVGFPTRRKVTSRPRSSAPRAMTSPSSPRRWRWESNNVFISPSCSQTIKTVRKRAKHEIKNETDKRYSNPMHGKKQNGKEKYNWCPTADLKTNHEPNRLSITESKEKNNFKT